MRQKETVEAITRLGYPAVKERSRVGPFLHLVCRSASWRVVMTIVLAALAVISWAFRPPSRTLGILFPPALFRRKKEA